MPNFENVGLYKYVFYIVQKTEYKRATFSATKTAQ